MKYQLLFILRLYFFSQTALYIAYLFLSDFLFFFFKPDTHHNTYGLFCLYLPGVQPGPLYGKLKNGTAIVLENGVTISPSDVLEDPIPGRKICILGDCSGVVGDAAMKLCCEADVLIHEATLDDTQEEKAREHGHSTPKMASEFAKLCKVKKLVLTHFSQRYKPAAQRGEGDMDVTELKRQAESVLDGQEVTLAEDFMTIEIPMKKEK